jgi:hypothetical protein
MRALRQSPAVGWLPCLGLCLGAVAMAGLAGCMSVGGPKLPPVTVPQIVQMSTNGVPAAEIIAKIRASRTVYRLKASQFADLVRDGVPRDVVDYMQQTYLEAVRNDARYEEWGYWRLWGDYWYGGGPCGWDFPPPRPVIIKRDRDRERHRERDEHGR